MLFLKRYSIEITATLFLLFFSCPVMSNSLWPHGLQQASPPCPSPSPKFAQVHVHCTGDSIQPPHPLMPSSPSTLNLSQHQGLFQWVGCPHQMTKYWSFNFSISPSNERWFPSRLTGLISLLSKRLSGVVSTTVRRRQFFVILPSLQSISHCKEDIVFNIIEITAALPPTNL